MEKIASFQVDHTTLLPGMYISRVDGDITTYDLRFVRPNTPPFLEVPAMHTIEHLMATYLRNSTYRDQVIYFGPMGCRTGFYFLSRSLDHQNAIALIRDALRFSADFTDTVPGLTSAECGNYREHDLEKAREYCRTMCEVLKNWDQSNLQYI